MRFRTTALPIFFVTVIPSRAAPGSPPAADSNRKPGKEPPRQWRKRKKSALFFKERTGSLACGCGAVAVSAKPSCARRAGLKRTASCGPWRGVLRVPLRHPWWPCAHGSRGGVCGRAGLADTVFSSVCPFKGEVQAIRRRVTTPTGRCRQVRFPAWRPGIYAAADPGGANVTVTRSDRQFRYQWPTR